MKIRFGCISFLPTFAIGIVCGGCFFGYFAVRTTPFATTY